MTQRKWQMIRVSAGDYLLPSNDRQKLWRIHRYEEQDGELVWAASRYRLGGPEVAVEDVDVLEWWNDRWIESGCFATRREAVDYAVAQ